MKNINKEILNKTCEKYAVDKLYVFGSFARNESNNNSDVDLLVSFKDNIPTNYFDNFFDLQFTLEEIFKKKIDLISESSLKNPYLINSINHDKVLIYG